MLASLLAWDLPVVDAVYMEAGGLAIVALVVLYLSAVDLDVVLVAVAQCW
jgi:hypothetical protein